MTVKMEALKTFYGMEGYQKRGDTFDARDYNRAKVLSEHGLAKVVSSDKESDLSMSASLEKGETWGIESLGGVWFALPSGEKIQGFENALRGLLEELQTYLHEKAEEENSPPEHEEVRLLPVIGAMSKSPEIIYTGEPEDSNLDPFDVEVKYLGGGWYELPNDERVQGKDQAKSVYEAYMRARKSSET